MIRIRPKHHVVYFLPPSPHTPSHLPHPHLPHPLTSHTPPSPPPPTQVHVLAVVPSLALLDGRPVEPEERDAADALVAQQEFFQQQQAQAQQGLPPGAKLPVRLQTMTIDGREMPAAVYVPVRRRGGGVFGGGAASDVVCSCVRNSALCANHPHPHCHPHCHPQRHPYCHPHPTLTLNKKSAKKMRITS